MSSGFVVEGVDMGGPSSHEEEDDALVARAGRTGELWRERVAETCLPKKGGEREGTESTTGRF